ncbi:MAG: hypothetical protein L0227_16080, partial [Chloroflexi bacterium]|nr:hypothetical protein [Chloroflexota bacterium]
LGTDVTFRVTVRNRGTLDSPDTNLRLTVTDGVTVRDVALNSLQLAGGAAATFDVLWRVDLEGALELVAEVDPEGLVPETDEDNNLATLPFTAGALDVANLEVSFQDLVFDPDPGEEGRPLTLSILVRNTGGEPVTGVEVAFYDGDPGAGGVQIEQRATIASLAPGEAATAAVVWQRVPTAADRLIFAVVDPDDAIEEFREDDNSAFETLVVLGLPDPAVSPASLDLEPPLPEPGQPATLTVTVSNLGQQGVENLVVRAFDGHPDLGGLPLGDQVIGSLAGDGAAITSFTWSPAGGERRPVVVLLDPDGAVEEASEANNRAEIDLVAQDGDFVLSERWFSPDGDGARDETTLFFRLGAPTDAEVLVIDAVRDLVVRRAAFSGTTGDEFTWDGRDDLGRLARDADYLLRLVDAAGAAVNETIVTLDTNR